MIQLDFSPDLASWQGGIRDISKTTQPLGTKTASAIPRGGGVTEISLLPKNDRQRIIATVQLRDVPNVQRHLTDELF